MEGGRDGRWILIVRVRQFVSVCLMTWHLHTQNLSIYSWDIVKWVHD